jgi:hypothetical protein
MLHTPGVGRYFGSAAAFLVLGSAGLVWIAPDLAAGLYPAPRVAAVTHLFTLGFLTLTIFGALGQLLPVALGASRYSAPTALRALWLFVPGIVAFAAGVASARPVPLVAGVALVAGAILMTGGNAARSLASVRNRDAMWGGVAVAVGFLGATLVYGALLADNLHAGMLGGARLRVLAAHLHVALVGWVLIMIVGVSHRLLPMFLASSESPRRATAPAVALLAVAVPLLAGGLTAGSSALEWTGLTLGEAGVALYLWQAVSLFRARRRRALDTGMQFVRVALVWLTLAALLAPAVLAAGPAARNLATAYGVAGILGALVPFVIGMLYEIVPVLSWNTRFAGRLNRGPLPRIKELYSGRIAAWQLACMAGGTAVLVAGIGLSTPAVARAGAVVVLGGTVLFGAQLVRIRWGSTAAAVRSREPSLQVS